MPWWRSTISTMIAKAASRRATTSAGVRDARRGGEAADVDEHDADTAHLAELGGADGEQPVDHLRRDVLAEQIGDAVARRGRVERALEMALDRDADRTGEQPGAEQHHAAGQDGSAMPWLRSLGAPGEMQLEIGEDE